MEQIMARVSEAHGWTMTVAGIGTVFLTLICIWLFITIFSKFTTVETAKQPGSASKPPEPKPAPQESLDDPATAQETVGPVQADDTVARMAAAAALTVYLKRRKTRSVGAIVSGAAGDPWLATGRLEGLHNQPVRNSWRGDK